MGARLREVWRFLRLPSTLYATASAFALLAIFDVLSGWGKLALGIGFVLWNLSNRAEAREHLAHPVFGELVEMTYEDCLCRWRPREGWKLCERHEVEAQMPGGPPYRAPEPTEKPLVVTARPSRTSTKLGGERGGREPWAD